MASIRGGLLPITSQKLPENGDYAGRNAISALWTQMYIVDAFLRMHYDGDT